MDLTWPLTNSDASEGTQPAVDFMVNAFKLLNKEGSSQSSKTSAANDATDAGQGKGDTKGKKPPKAQNTTKATKGARKPSECWDGCLSDDEDVEFVKRSWSLFQQAMDEGWVTDWVSKYTHPDIIIYDAVARAKAQGHAEVCCHYNRVLEAVWGNGQSALTWIPHSFSSMGPGSGIVTAEYNIEIVPKIEGHHGQQLWMYRVSNEKLMELRVYPISHFSPTTFRSVSATAQVKNDKSQSNNNNQPVGVALTKPCSHNSWDNVRVKRGWAILRCRICHLQWRLRPTAIPHCDSFARGTGCCPMGVECTQLHVHRTREQTEAKKQNEVASRTSGGELVEAGSVNIPNGSSNPPAAATLPTNRTLSGTSDGLPAKVQQPQHIQQSYSSHSPYENYTTESTTTYGDYEYDYLDQSTSKQHQPYATPEEVPVRSLQVHQQQFLQQQYQQIGYQQPLPSYPEQKAQPHPPVYQSQEPPPPPGAGIPTYEAVPSPMVQHPPDPSYRSMDQQQSQVPYQQNAQMVDAIPGQAPPEQKPQPHAVIYPPGQEQQAQGGPIPTYDQSRSPMIQHNPDPNISNMSTPNSAPSQPPPMYQHPPPTDGGTVPVGYSHIDSQSQAPAYGLPVNNRSHQMPHPVHRIQQIS
eukprot:TRINITY_DN13562_c0_g1_i1.p1 TRINITY_DN13562_c0_g1~~TRINITY_DN13562_c0_g1_i1.p1  ORF type:complete len:635 (+),score=89.66 TRINITY_DN13562_c0_g1_i1:40-1944(+)